MLGKLDLTLNDGYGYGTVFELSPRWLWTAGSSQSWSIASNWDMGTIPNAQTRTVIFGNSIGNSAVTVALASAVTVGTLSFDNTLGGRYTLAGAATLTIDDTGDFSGVNPVINVLAGSHTIAAPLKLVAGVKITVNGGAALAINGAISGTPNIAATGGGSISFGTGVLPSTTALAISNATTVALASSVGSQMLASLSLDSTSTLNVGKQIVTVPDTGAAGSTYNTILSLIKSGYVNDLGHGISSGSSSSSTGVGIIDTGTQTKFGYTLLGDATMDGSVGFADLVKLAQNYATSGTDWATGDFNYDGSTGFADLVKLAQNYTLQVSDSQAGELDAIDPTFACDWAAAQAEAAAVPEPTGAGVLAVAAALTMVRRRRRT